MPSAFSFLADLSFNQMVLGLALIVFTGILVFQRLRRRRSHQTTNKAIAVSSIPESLTIQPRLVFTKAEASLYNLIRLAVQDSYLVLAKLPMRNLVKLEVRDEATRRGLLKTMQKVSLDFVLVHPGSLAPAWVIQLDNGSDVIGGSPDQRQLTDALFQEAGIAVLRLNMKTTYTLPQLVELLGLAEDD